MNKYLKPVRILWALLCCKDLNESLVLVTRNVVPICPWEVAVERSRVELRQHIDLWHIAVQTVADRDIYEPVIGAQWYCRLCPLLRQWVQPCPSTTSKDNPKNTLQQKNGSNELHVTKACRNIQWQNTDGLIQHWHARFYQRV